mmetsp:Transcript_26168/g.57299  ORF Transcript_26168/g.57299 Transcript_26168/m.57299 type:complete len:219 (+) Transcript_26168:662-1318(+)
MAAAMTRWAARRLPIKDSSDRVSVNRYGVRTKSTVCSRPSNSTKRPSLPIVSTALAANFTTSPWVTSATVGIFLETLGDFSSVFWTSDMYMSRPRPWMWVSYLPLNFPKVSMPTKDSKFSLVNAFSLLNPSSPGCCSHQVTARRVTLRKIFPLDQLTTCFPSSFSNFWRSILTVVPFPVPDSPHSAMTDPASSLLSSALSFPRISSATEDGVFPNTSI